MLVIRLTFGNRATNATQHTTRTTACKACLYQGREAGSPVSPCAAAILACSCPHLHWWHVRNQQLDALQDKS